jgi:uncharacterized LabA/DUF88 family protein
MLLEKSASHHTPNPNILKIMEIGKITRVSIFVDYDNFTSSYCKRHGGNEEDLVVWDCLCETLVDYYQRNFIKNDFEVVEHVGTFVCVGISDFPSQEERKIKKRFQALDRKVGFIVKYGDRLGSYRDPKTKELRLGYEKGVDAEIICQMLMGAFLDHYDSCILLSDDGDYVPAVCRVQDYFGKKVIQGGFKNSKLRNQCFANIPLEQADRSLMFSVGETESATAVAAGQMPSEP